MDASKQRFRQPAAVAGALIAILFLSGCPELFLPPPDAEITAADPDWFRVYGDPPRDRVGDLAIAPNGDLYIVGTRAVDSETQATMSVTKTDSSGQRLWSHRYGNLTVSSGHAVLATSDGGFLAGGAMRSTGAGRFDAFLVKGDADGEEQWSRTYGGDGYDFIHSIASTADGGYALAGYTRSFGAGKMDMYLVKTDADGNEIWTQTYGTDRYESAFRVCTTVDGGFLLVGYQGDYEYDGYSYYYGDDAVSFVVKTDAEGQVMWERTYRPYEFALATDGLQAADGSYLIVGDAGYTGFFTKLDADGNTVWSQTTRLYSYSTDLRRIAPTSDGGFILVGTIAGNDYDYTYDVLLMKLSNSGTVQWRQQVRTEGDTMGYAVAQRPDGRYIVAGTAAGPDDYYNEDVFALRADRP